MTLTAYGYLLLISIDFIILFPSSLLNLNFIKKIFQKLEIQKLTTFPKSSQLIKNTLQHSTCTCHIFSSFHNVKKLENVVKQNGLSCLRYHHIQRLQGLHSCRTWILHYDCILSSCAVVCSCICPCTLL